MEQFDDRHAGLGAVDLQDSTCTCAPPDAISFQPPPSTAVSPCQFPFESDLVEAVLRQVSEVVGVGAPESFAMSEVRAGTSLADIVVVRRKFKSWPRFPTRLSIVEAVSLSWLRKLGTTRIDLLESKCGLQRGALRQGTFDELVDDGLIQRGAGGSIGLRENWSNDVEIIAIEAKLSRWRKALRQAKDYLLFADRSYVALPITKERLVPKLTETFTAAGVGLLLVSAHQTVEALTARPSVNHSWKREVVLAWASRHLEA